MSSAEYGFHTVNGKQVAVDPDSPLTFPQGRSNILHLQTTGLEYHHLPLTRVIGGNHGDTFKGDAGIILGGDGDDFFFNTGVTQSDSFPNTTTAKARGGKGNDIFEDAAGSTDYFGGRGNDHFTTDNFYLWSRDGDVDRVHLGYGQDTAHVDFTNIDDPAGETYAPRTVSLDGGKGQDTLALTLTRTTIVLSRAEILDFRSALTGEEGFQGVTFSNFETFYLQIGTRFAKELHVGHGDDIVVWFDVNGQAQKTLEIFGHSGDDYLIGSYDAKIEDKIFGGNGNDIISGAGAAGAGFKEWLFGGNGDDMLLASAIGTTGQGVTRMKGGSGSDVFVLGHGSRIEHFSRVVDFTPGQDKIGLDYRAKYFLNADNPFDAIQELKTEQVEILRDNDWRFQFTMEFTNIYGEDQSAEWLYKKHSGTLFYNSGSTDGPEWEKVAVLKDAPELAIQDFVFFDWI